MADKNPNTHLAVIKALIRASMWLDAENNKNRNEAWKCCRKNSMSVLTMRLSLTV